MRNGALQIIQEALGDADVCGLLDIRTEELSDAQTKELSRMNGGFLVIRCSAKTVDFWKAIRAFPKKSLRIEQWCFYEQNALNELFIQHPEIKTNYLPDVFWCDHRSWLKVSTPGPLPLNVVFLHATAHIDSIGKKWRIQEVQLLEGFIQQGVDIRKLLGTKALDIAVGSIKKYDVIDESDRWYFFC